MKLFYRKIGEHQPALIILHGLYGSSDNWMSIGKSWANNYEVYLVDLRNHGRSPHSSKHSYKAMQNDILELMDKLKIRKSIIVGHSMGGKVAMQLAMNYPERINALVVIDIAPKNYLPHTDENVNRHRTILTAMLGLKLDELKRREEINDILLPSIPEERTRMFIMKNLKRNKNQGFSWKLNLETIAAELLNITKGFSEKDIKKNIVGFPILFVRGDQSKYIQEEDIEKILQLFPMAEIESISQAGHWIHAEQPEALTNIILEFLED